MSITTESKLDSLVDFMRAKRQTESRRSDDHGHDYVVREITGGEGRVVRIVLVTWDDGREELAAYERPTNRAERRDNLRVKGVRRGTPTDRMLAMLDADDRFRLLPPGP